MVGSSLRHLAGTKLGGTTGPPPATGGRSRSQLISTLCRPDVCATLKWVLICGLPRTKVALESPPSRNMSSAAIAAPHSPWPGASPPESPLSSLFHSPRCPGCSCASSSWHGAAHWLIQGQDLEEKVWHQPSGTNQPTLLFPNVDQKYRGTSISGHAHSPPHTMPSSEPPFGNGH